MTSPSDGREAADDSRPEPVESLPAAIVPLGGDELVVTGVAVDESPQLDDAADTSARGPAEHRAEPQARPRGLRLRSQARGNKLVVFAVTGVVVFAVVAAVVVVTLGGPSSLPVARENALMGYDPATGQMLLTGGDAPVRGDLSSLAQTWNWNGSRWSETGATVGPFDTEAAAIVYDGGTRQLMLMSGTQLWTWNGASWQLQPGIVSAPQPPVVGLSYDAATRQVIGVFVLSAFNYTSSTWLWESDRWRELQGASGPPTSLRGAIGYDAATGQLVYVAQAIQAGSGSPVASVTWIWSEDRWQKVTHVVEPPYTQFRSLAYDQATKQLVLYEAPNDTWAWTGNAWVHEHPKVTPPQLVGAALAYDTSTHQLLLFGGVDPGGYLYYNDTWDWTGTTWVKVA